jgi:hypothetical protein
MYKSVTVDLKLYSYNVKLYMALYIYIYIYKYTMLLDSIWLLSELSPELVQHRMREV